MVDLDQNKVGPRHQRSDNSKGDCGCILHLVGICGRGMFCCKCGADYYASSAKSLLSGWESCFGGYACLLVIGFICNIIKRMPINISRSCYALLTLFDFALAVIPIWSILKLAVFSLFFLRPWRLATRIRVLMLLREVRRSRTMEKGHSVSWLLWTNKNIDNLYF